MKLIKPSFEIINPTDLSNALKGIELAARTCYKSENKICEGSDVELVGKLIKSGHEAMLEFGPSIIVKFICDRGISHELVRHRLASFAQESTRYCNYSKDKFDTQVSFIIPSWTNLQEMEISKEEMEKDLPDKVNPAYTWMWTMIYLERRYHQLTALGWAPQQARSILPNSLKTEIHVKANIREWRHIFKQRTPTAAHPQMRELMVPLLADFKALTPVLFDDI